MNNILQTSQSLILQRASAIQEKAFDVEVKGGNSTRINSISMCEADVHSILQISAWPEHIELTQRLLNEYFDSDFQLINTTLVQQYEMIKCVNTQPNKWLLLFDDKQLSTNRLEKKLQAFCNDSQACFLNQSSTYSIINIQGINAYKLMQKISFLDYLKQINLLENNNNLKASSIMLATQVAAAYNAMVEVKSLNDFNIYITRTLARSLWDYIALMAELIDSRA